MARLMVETSSGALIGRIAAGQQDALGEFYDRYAGLVNGLALRILRDPSDAEDVVQEVFVQAWRQADRFDPARGTPEAWLCTLARTRALDKLRRRVSRREEPAEAAPGTTAAPRNVEVLAVRKALEDLSANQRRALELAYYEGLTQSEIAERLGEPLGTIKTRIRTAMMRLREALSPLPPTSSEPEDSAKTETG
jgi:RNA polymerase sigma-70 factor (ECF subfamily)